MALPSLAHWPILLIFIYLASSCHSANYEYNLLVPMSDSSSAQWMSVAKLAAVELSNSWPAHTFKVNLYDHMDSMVTIGQLAYHTVQNTSVLGVAVLSSNPNLVLQSAITLNFASVPVLSVSESRLPPDSPKNLFSFKSSNHSIHVLSQYLDSMNWTSIGISYSDDSYGHEMLESITGLGGVDSDSHSFSPSATLFNTEMKHIWRDSHNIIIVISKNHDQVSLILKEADDIGLFAEGRAWIVIGVDDPSLVASPPDGTFFITNPDGNLTLSDTFLSKLRGLNAATYPGTGPGCQLNHSSMLIYDSIHTLAKATLDAPSATRSNILTTLQSGFSYEGASGRISFDSSQVRIDQAGLVLNSQNDNLIGVYETFGDYSSDVEDAVYPGPTGSAPDDLAELIPIGYFQPLSGPFAFWPASFINSMMSFYQDYINNNTDILPPNSKISFIVVDDKNAASLALTQAFNFADFGLGGIIGSLYTDTTQAIQYAVSPFHIPQINTANSEPRFSDKVLYPTLLRNVPSDIQQGVAMYDLCKYYGWDEVSILSSTDSITSAMAQTFINLALANNIKIANRISLPDSKSNYDEEIQQLKDSKARIVLGLIFTNELGKVSNSLMKVDYKPAAWIGALSVAVAATLPGFVDHPEVFDNWITFNQISATGQRYSEVQSYLNANAAKYPGASLLWSYPSSSAIRTLEASEIFALAFKRVVAAGGNPRNGTAVLQELYATNYTNGLTGSTQFDSNGDKVAQYDITHLGDGKQVVLGRWTVSGSIRFDKPATFMDGSTNIPLARLPRTNTWLKWSSPAGIVFAILSISGMIASVIMFLIVIFQRESVVIKTATYQFLLVMLIGTAVGYGSMLTWIGEPKQYICGLRVWLPPMAFILIIAPLLTKTWRLHRIFTLSSLKIVPIPLWRLVLMTVILIVIQAAICIVWISAGTVQPRIIDDKQDSTQAFVVCNYNMVNRVASYVTYGYLGLLMVVGAYLAFRVRNLPKDFNESRWIGFSIYNTLLFSIIILILGYALSSFPITVLILICVCTFATTTGAVAFMMVPKLWDLLMHPDRRSGSSGEKKTSSLKSTTGGARSEPIVRHDYSKSSVNMTKSQ